MPVPKKPAAGMPAPKTPGAKKGAVVPVKKCGGKTKKKQLNKKCRHLTVSAFLF